MTKLARILAVLGVLLLTALGLTRLWLQGTVAPISGREAVSGQGDSVIVLFDSLAVPHVIATSDSDLFTALGYLHARDRLWQMDLLRHAGQGRLSELFGEATVEADRDLRRLELARLARERLAALAPESRPVLDAYVRGVNAWIARGERGIELLLVGHRVEPWLPEHSVVIGLLQAWDLRTTGSNAWVVAGSRTASGKPILANDPHLALRAPSVWYLAGLHGPTYQVVGATIPGIPVVILGHNRHLAWGFTNAMVDDVDYLGPDSTLRWTAQDPSDELGAILAMGRARNRAEFVAGAARFQAPEQNVVYADTAGNIGYLLAGRVPVRGRGGRWIRYLTLAERPQSWNPAAGYVVTANHRMVDQSYPFFISNNFEPGYRASRIAELIEGEGDSGATVASTARHQLDVLDVFAREHARLAAAAAAALGRDEVAQRLRAWDGTMAADRSEPTVFWTWHRALERRADADSQAAMREALALDGVPWGSVHTVASEHPLSRIPVLGRLIGFTLGPRPAGGSNYTVNVALSSRREPPFPSAYGPSLRHVVDLADPDGGGGFITPTGQSGNPFSRHYGDQEGRWRTGRLWVIPLDVRRVNVRARLILY